MSAATMPTELVGPSGRAASRARHRQTCCCASSPHTWVDGMRVDMRQSRSAMSVCGTYLINLL